MFGQTPVVRPRWLTPYASSTERYAASQSLTLSGEQDWQMKRHNMDKSATCLLAGLACALAEMLMPEMISNLWLWTNISADMLSPCDNLANRILSDQAWHLITRFNLSWTSIQKNAEATTDRNLFSNQWNYPAVHCSVSPDQKNTLLCLHDRQAKRQWLPVTNNAKITYENIIPK